MRAIYLNTLLCLVVAFASQAHGGITFNSQNRYVQKGKHVDFSPDVNDPPIAAPDFGPFLVGSLSSPIPDGNNSTFYQNSTIGPNSLDAMVRVDEGFATFPTSWPWVISQYEVAFTLSDPTPYTLTTKKDWPGVSNDAVGKVTLTQTSPTHQTLNFPVSASSSLSTYTGTLPPGQWTFNATALGDEDTPFGPTSYGVITSLQLPEPSGAALLLLTAGAALARGRGRTIQAGRAL